MRKLTTLLAAALIAMPFSLLVGCAPATNNPAEVGVPVIGEISLVLTNGWAKAGEIGGMTGVFGTLENPGDDDLTITAVESPDAGVIELHEVTADGVMRAIEGDVTVPAKGSFELAPGANHIMLMDLKRDLLAGDEVTFTLHLASKDGTESSATLTVLVKDYAGANENYGVTQGEGVAHGPMPDAGMEHADEPHASS